MSPRLIPWCLAATGFLASLTTFTWPGNPSLPGQQATVRTNVLRPFTRPVRKVGLPQVPAPAEAPENAIPTLILPLPPDTQPDPDPTVQPVPDDEPTVEDLPAPHSPPESPDGE